MDENIRIAGELLGLARELVAQRRKDKDIPHLPGNNDKSKLRDDRKKPQGLDRKDPDSKDVKRDPDMKKACAETARMLVAMARAFIAYDNNVKKVYEIDEKNGMVKVGVIWNDGNKNYFCDILDGSEIAGTEFNKLTPALKNVGVTRTKDDSTKPFDSPDRTYYLTSIEDEGDDVDSMVIKYKIGDDAGDFESVLSSHGFKKGEV